ncbi:hypothetical protein Ddc_15051 [Ditylenchus destructor]|nr:hypothetical protein Ddc_15051 [Ditylenchus destructor]
MESSEEEKQKSALPEETENKDTASLLNPELVTSTQSTTPTTADDEHLSDSLKTVVIAGEETEDIPKEDIPKDDIPKESTEKPSGTMSEQKVEVRT